MLPRAALPTQLLPPLAPSLSDVDLAGASHRDMALCSFCWLTLQTSLKSPGRPVGRPLLHGDNSLLGSRTEDPPTILRDREMHACVCVRKAIDL